MSDRPIVRLRPKAPAKSLRFGAPWVYADWIVLDRRTRGLSPGSIVTLEDNERRPLGTAAFNPASKIALRLLDPNPAAQIDAAWFAQKLDQARALRSDLYPTPHYRLIHAEADGLPGIVIDRYDEVAVLQPNAAWAEALIDPLTEAIASIPGITSIWKSASGRARTLEGLDDQSGVLRGPQPARLTVPMNGACYVVDPTGGQKTGIFYDQRDNHAFAARLAGGRDVLDMFAYVGGFGLAALAGGARSVLAVDASEPALELARAGAEAGGVADAFSTEVGDGFDVLARLGEEPRRFGLVVCDPPAFAPGRPALEAGLRAYERVARLAARLVGPWGYLVLCSCSHAVDRTSFREASLRGVGKAGRRARILSEQGAGPDHPVHPALAESGYLKALFLALAP